MPTDRSRLGSRGERLAQEHIGNAGYQIVETNYRCQWGEVDIIARDDYSLVFVETKNPRDGDRYSFAYKCAF